MSFDDFLVSTIGRNDYRSKFWLMTKASSRIK